MSLKADQRAHIGSKGHLVSPLICFSSFSIELIESLLTVAVRHGNGLFDLSNPRHHRTDGPSR